MGSSASGRYATDRSDITPFWHPPYPEVVEHLRACRTASRTRFYRNADVVWWVADCEQAKADILDCDRALEQLGFYLENSERPDRARAAEVRRTLERRREVLVDRRREASRQLRLIGISPQEQALIRDELLARSAKAQ